MSIKDLFGKTSGQIVTEKDVERLKQDVESVGYIEEKQEDRQRFVPKTVVDFDDPKTFAKYGSAEKYYVDAIDNILSTYPYDGSYKEKLEWRNQSTYIDNYIFDNEYPRTTGYVLLNEPQAHPAGPVLSGLGWDYRSVTTSPQHIFFEGGMNPTPINEDGKLSSEYPDKGNSNIYDPETFRESNLYAVGEIGNTIEFWWKREPDPTTGISAGSECLFDMWNNEVVGDPVYGRIVIEHWNDNWQADPTVNGFAKFTYYSDGAGVQRQTLGTSLSPADFNPNEWHHYAFTAINSGADLLIKFHVDGELVDEVTAVGQAIGAIDWIPGLPMTARIGAYQTEPVTTEIGGLFGTGTYGSLQGSVDEFRFWKKARSSKEIGRFWFTQFGGGTNTDEANTALGVYYKFNEGIVDTSSIAAVDANVLDYSGRITNGSITNYDLGVRSVESAIDEYGANNVEFRDPIMYSFHPDVQTLREVKQQEGYEYDLTNISSIVKSIPAWIIEEEENTNGTEVRNLIQIISSYFDTLHLQIEALPTIGSAEYVQDGEKPIPFAKHLLESKGFVAPEIFIDTTVLEYLADRAEDRTYEEDVDNIKNEIYQNIYNNLSNIYKSKGTEKAFRNLLRCFGIGDELIKINLYGDGVKYKLEDYYRSVSVKKSYVDFNNPDRFDGYVKQLADPAIPDSKSYIEGATSPDLTYIPITMESEVVFPKKLPLDHPDFFRTPFTTVSLFGLHNVGNAPGDIDTWTDSGFAVYAEKREEESTEVKFVLQPYGFAGAVPMETGWYKDVYENEKWNIAVRVRPTVNKLDLIQNASTGILDPDYVLEFYGVNMVLDIVQEEFSLTQSLDLIATETFLNTEKRSYIGAEYTDFTTLNERSDAKISSTRVWLDYLDDDTIKSHAKDVENYGTKDPYKEAYFSQTSVADVRVPQADTLLLHWDFQTVGASDGSGEFIVSDTAYGPADARYGAVLGNILGYQYTGLGTDFFADDKKVTDKTYVFSAKQQLPENISSSTTVNILTQDDDVFTRESAPFNYFWAIEKSMYQTISDEMIDIFASISAFNNLIGEPVNRYRTEYKDLTKLRQLFFERIENKPDIEKYIEFYKWLDAAVNQMLQQLIPASANFSQDMRTMIESHILERNKYRNKYQYFGPRKDEDPTPLLGINEMLYNWKQGRARVEEDESCLWWKVRARRDEAPLATGDSEVDADRQQIHDVSTRVNSGSWESRSLAYGSDTKNMTEYQGQTFALRSLSQPYRFKVDDQPVVKSGTNVYRNKKKDYVKVETQQFSGTTIVVQEAPGYANSSCIDDEDKNALKKEKVAFSAANQKYATGTYENSAKGLILSPIDLYQDIVNDQNYWTNLHDDSYGEDKETPMQGPFTQAHVGGSPHRHVPINETDRPEAWEFDGTTFSEPADGRAKFYRDETAKRPLNIKNIKYDIDDAIYGNYRYDYEIVQTSSRRLNNVWFVKQQGVLPGSTASTASDAVYGHYDFDLPNRGRNEHVFVERFSAPGSSDTLARGMMDVESEEFSPYNSLNFRNLNVRTKLNQWLTFHSKFGGDSASCDNPTDQYPCVPSFHKVQRNGKQQFLPGGVSPFCETKYDNFWKSQLIPSTDYNYHWISQSTQSVTRWCRTGYVDESENVSTYFPEINTNPYSADYGLPGIAAQVIAGEIEFDYGLPFDNNFQSYEGVRHPRTYDKIVALDDADRPIKFVTLPETWGGTFRVGDAIMVESEWDKYVDGDLTLNQVLLNRYGPWQLPSWKQIRAQDSVAVRFMRTNNIVSIENEPKPVTVEVPNKQFQLVDPTANPVKLLTFKPQRERLANNYVEPAISWNKPMQHRLQFRGGSVGAKVYHPYSNNLELFANPFINKRLGLENKNKQLYDTILEQYITDNNRYGPRFFELKYEEYIYPKHRNATLKKTRQRLRYAEDRNNGVNGIDRKTSDIRTFWYSEPTSRQRRVYNPQTFELTAKNALGYQARNSSVWALDYFKYLDPASCDDITSDCDNCKEQVMRGDLAWAGFAQYRGYVYEPASAFEILQAGEEEGNGRPSEQTWVAPRPVLQLIHNPNSQKAREEGWSWRAGDISGNAPWYNSYEAFSVDVRLMGQSYSIVPEYRISEHMDFYVNKRGGNFRAENKELFEIVGNVEDLKDSGDFITTSVDYFSYDGIVEVTEYEYEPNYALGYEDLALGNVSGTASCDIADICIEEPPGDIDSNIRNWRCADPYPVATYNTDDCSPASGQDVTIDLAQLLPAVNFVDETNEQAFLSSEFKGAIPLSFAPLQNPDLCTLTNLSADDLEEDRKIFFDRWENTFMLSFWVNFDNQKLFEDFSDKEEVPNLTKSVGGFTIKQNANTSVLSGNFLDKTPAELIAQIDGVNTEDELEQYFNNNFTLEPDPNGAFPTNPWGYYQYYQQYTEKYIELYGLLALQGQGNITPQQEARINQLVDELAIISPYVEPYTLYPNEDTKFVSFYFADHEDDSNDTYKQRPYWADSIGNKVYFNVEFFNDLKTASSWNHVCLLYVGGSATENEAQLGYDSRHHRIFMWVNNNRVATEAYDIPAYEAINSNHATNGTLHMGIPRVDDKFIESLGTGADAFQFGKCAKNLNFDAGTIGYSLDEALLPAKLTDLSLVRGGDVGIQFVPDPTVLSSGDESGICNNEETFAVNYRWFFDNTKSAGETRRFKSSLCKAFYGGQCQDVNEVYGEWKDTECDFNNNVSITDNPDFTNLISPVLETDPNENCPRLVGWWKLGIARFNKQTYEAFTWTEDFFKCYGHTDDINFIEKVSQDHKPLGEGSSKVLRLEVDAIKKLLPYNGFYPSQRAVQIGSLFYDSVAPYVEGRNDGQQWERARTEQALLQPFFSPGILFNSIKSGIAVDWAAYSGQYEINGTISMRDVFLGQFSISEAEGENEDSSDSNNSGFAGGSGRGFSGGDGLNNSSSGAIVALKNTQAGKAVIERATAAMRRDVQLGVLEKRNLNVAFKSYYDKALNTTLETYQSLSKKLARATSARGFEIWAADRGLDPYSAATQEQYRATKVRDVDWKYLPDYRKTFPKGLKSLVDKSYNAGTDNELKEVNSIVLDLIDKTSKLPPAKFFNVEFKADGEFEVGGALDLTQELPTPTAGTGPNAKGLNNPSAGINPVLPPGPPFILPDPDAEQTDDTIFQQPPSTVPPTDSIFNPTEATFTAPPTQDDLDEEALEETLRLLEGGYLNEPPNFRIPFEGLVSIDSVLPLKDSDEASKIFFLAPSFYTYGDDQGSLGDQSRNRYPYFEWTGRKNVLYELAMNNFLAEIPNFFLKAKGFTTFASKPEKEFKTVIAGREYYMDVHLYKTDNFAMTISPYDGDAVLVNRFGDVAQSDENLIDGDGNPYTTQGRYYGPALRYKTRDLNNEDVFYVGDPAQAPYVPPYFYGRAKARIMYTPDFNGKPTLDNILNNLTIEYINEEMDYLFASKSGADLDSQDSVDDTNDTSQESWKNVPAYVGRMPIEASINFFGKTKQRNVSYDVIDTGFQFNAADETEKTFLAKTAEDTVEGADVWTISPRFECPTLNFDTIENKSTRIYETPAGSPQNLSDEVGVKGFKSSLDKCSFKNEEQDGRDKYGAVSRDPRGVGMWSGFGFIPSEEEGIFITLEDSYKKKKDVNTPIKCTPEDDETQSNQKVLLAIKTDTRFTHINFITITDVYGNAYEITIGQPSDQDTPDIGKKQQPLSNQEASLLSLSGIIDLYEDGKKIQTVLTTEESTVSNPEEGMLGRFDVEAFLNKDADLDSTSPDFSGQLPESSDIANGVCYHINYRYNDPNDDFAFKARVRWVSENQGQVAGSSSEREEIYNIVSADFVGYGAVIEIEWAPDLSNPFYQGQQKIADRCTLDILGAPSVSDIGLKYVTQSIKIDSAVESAGPKLKQADKPFYVDVEQNKKVLCEEVGSLIDVCGFTSSRNRIGDIADEKEISEAVVMVPFIDEPLTSTTKASTVEVMDRNFFKISKKLFNFTKSNVDAGKPAIPKNSIYDVEEDIDETSVSDMIKKMQRYNIPPMLDFITYPLKKGEFPFVMYIFEFTETLDKNDLSNIWQGLMPQISRTATKQSQIIEHEMNRVNFFEGKEIPENIRWMVFRVKRKANINYFQVTADSQDDDRFKFNFDFGIKEPEYSYNWPYDFCSLVEMARIKGGISVLPPAPTILGTAEPIKSNKAEQVIEAHTQADSKMLIKKTSNNIVDWDDTKENDE